MSKSLVLLSGGMDSAVVLGHELRLGNEVEVVYFAYGSRQNTMEFVASYKLCDHCDVELIQRHRVDVRGLFGLISRTSALTDGGVEVVKGIAPDDAAQGAMVVPFRNGVFLSMAAAIAEGREFDAVCIGVHPGNEEVYPDVSVDFIAAANELVRVGTGGKVSVRAPLVTMSKASIIRYGEEMDVPWELTYSCYEGGRIHCGECGACLSRRKGFADAQVIDPTDAYATSRKLGAEDFE